LDELGFSAAAIRVRSYDLSGLENYHLERDLPGPDRTTHLSPHLRFGTVSIRSLVREALQRNSTFLSELIWREFFMQVLFHHPRVVDENFHRKYNGIRWRNDEKDFERWCKGETGYPLVDAGMRQLKSAGTMHNRVRMVCASFLCKHLLIDWRWGEGYFAGLLLDYELSSNNGNWQWAAGTGCDAAPYFRVFNPQAQLEKFDRSLEYVRRWIPEFGTSSYPKPMVDHALARERALRTYKEGISQE
jgi:deoxyribodipyrimidine photo-lyase